MLLSKRMKLFPKEAAYDDAKAKADQADSDKLAAEVNLHMLRQAAEKRQPHRLSPLKIRRKKK